MSTAYYHYDDKREFLGTLTLEKQGHPSPRKVFTWAINPARYLWSIGATLIIDEFGAVMERSYFVEFIVGNCEVQHYDIRAIPAG